MTNFIGTVLDDTLVGDVGDDVLDGLAGNDWLTGSDGNDVLYGGDGNDTLEGGSGADTLSGGAGNDVAVFAGLSSEYLVGYDVANDSYYVAHLSEGSLGVDVVSGVEVFQFADGSRTPAALQPPAMGTHGDDSLVGSDAADVLLGLSGGDTLRGMGGDDYLDGGPGYQDHLYGGAGNDTLYGGAGGNRLDGGDGNDVLDGRGSGVDLADYSGASAAVSVDQAAGTATGGAGDDTLMGIETVWGSNYDDTLVGDSGANNLLGGAGNDSLDGGLGNDTLNATGNDTLQGGGGIDTVEFSGVFLTASLITGIATSTAGTATLSGIENLWGTGFADSLTGDAGDNTINGWDGQDTLLGGAGNDSLFGAYGGDVLVGGSGDDLLSGWIKDQVLWNDGYDNIAVFSGVFADYTIAYGAGFATVTDSVAGRDGTDTLMTVTILQFADGMRSLFPLTGTSGSDMLIGTGLAETLDGLAGNDTVAGGDGNDTLTGGLGDDRLEGGFGIDTASYAGTAAVNVTLATARAQATLGAGADIIIGIENLIGGDGNDTLAGNALGNRLEGGIGSDLLDGGAGADVLVGGAGDDVYWVDDAGDIVTEASEEGVDIINSAVTFTLEAAIGVENLALTGTAANSGTGNALRNTLVGNGAINGLYGGGGDDILQGLAGNDVLRGGAGNDALVGGSGTDNMAGGAGDDFYAVDSSSDVVAESEGEGIDTVGAAVSYVLGANVENLTLAAGSRATAGTGNMWANRITGNGAANNLKGGAGADTLDGGLGADTLTGGADADVFRFGSALAKNIAKITDFNVADDTIELGGVFLSLGGGPLQASAFQSAASSVAATAAVRIIFNTATGALLYDADGAGGGAAIQFATLVRAGLVGTVTAADFVVPDFSVI